MKKVQIKLLIGSFVVVAAIGYLVYAGIKETSVYYLTVSEAMAMTTSQEDFRIEGNVVSGSIKRAPDSLGVEFMISDSENQIAINYHGTIPDMFKDKIEVVVQGRFDRNTGVFLAHTLLTGCPSRYEAAKEGRTA